MKNKKLLIFNTALLLIEIGATYYFWNTENNGKIILKSAENIDVGVYQGDRKIDAFVVDANTSTERRLDIGSYTIQVWHRASTIPKENQAPRRFSFDINRSDNKEINIDYTNYGILQLDALGDAVNLKLDNTNAFEVQKGMQEYLVPAGTYTAWLTYAVRGQFLELDEKITIKKGQTTTLSFGMNTDIDALPELLYKGRRWKKNTNTFFAGLISEEPKESPCEEGWRLPTVNDWQGLLSDMKVRWDGQNEGTFGRNAKPILSFLEMEWNISDEEEKDNDYFLGLINAMLETSPPTYFLLTEEYWNTKKNAISIIPEEQRIFLYGGRLDSYILDIGCYCIQDQG